MIQQTITLPDQSIAQLNILCQQEIDDYIRCQKGNSEHCLEIVRRATQGDSDALSILLNEITRIMVAKKYRKKYKSAEPFSLDDLQQAVSERLIKKFRSDISPYKTTTFAGYHAYVNITADNIASNWLTRGAHKYETTLSTGILRLPGGNRPEHEVQKRERQRALLQLLNLAREPLIREVLRLRIGYAESIDNVLQTLQPRHPDLTSEKLYRLVEKGKRQIRSHPDYSRIYDDYKSM